MKEITKGFKSGLIVGAVMDLETLTAAKKLPEGRVDFFEIRIDALASRAGSHFSLQDLKGEVASLVPSKIVTVRHGSQGGMHDFTRTERSAIYSEMMPLAAAIDIEARLISGFEKTVAEAKEQGVKVILSEHDFQSTPTLRSLRTSAKKALAAGGDIFKVAAQANTLSDVGVLATFLGEADDLGIPLAVMGMGPFGKVSRLLLASGGSVLNYCSLSGGAAIPGQWSAEGFRERLAELSR